MTRRCTVPAIKRAFEIIELLAKRNAGLSISEIHRALHLPLSSAAAILYTLRDMSYVERDEETSRYYLSVKMLGIARQALDRLDLVAKCHKWLEEAVRESGLTGHLAVLRDGESMYIDRVQSESLVQVSSYVGQRWPVHVSAVGKALLAFLPETNLQTALQQMTLRGLTPYTITSRQALARQLRAFRRLGYCWERNEGEMGLGCVAAPVFGPQHEVVAAMSLSGTTQQISRARVSPLGKLVKKYAQQMSARLGGQS